MAFPVRKPTPREIDSNMRTAPRILLASALTGIAILATGRDAATQQPGVLSVAATQGTGIDGLRRWDATVDRMTRTGDLVVASRLADRALPGRMQEYLAQTVDGIRVHGGGISRQLDGGGVTVSLLGTLHQGIEVDTTPALSGEEVAALLERMHGGEILAGRRPALVVLPLPDGSHALTYRIPMTDRRFYFVDANDGRILHVVDAVMSQSAIGAGAGARGDRKKLSTTQAGGRFEARDGTRPGELVTLDARFNFRRFARLILNHFIDELPPGEPVWTADDVASDADNDWDDPAVVDTHAHGGWTYDYFAARHGWEGIDGANGRVLSIVNVRGANAAFFLPPLGPEGNGAFVYGRTEEETSEDPWTSLDIVGHELMHGVTHFSVSQRTGNEFGLFTDFAVAARLGPTSFVDAEGQTHACDTARFPGLTLTPEGLEPAMLPAWCVNGRFLLASSQGGAVHEAYSDIFGEALGFFHEDAGASADYLVGGDHEFGPIRSLIDPKSLRNGFYPDTYGDRYEFAIMRDADGFWDYSGIVFVDRRFAFSLDGFGYGGSHWNSLILSHAFYLAIEGGTHRGSGMRVEGVGGANRAAIERIFFRAMTELMPSATSLPLTADVIRQAAADLAPGIDAEHAIDQALRAVGLPPQANF